jgi:ATP-binding cassette subfamily B multidrug efflux pump
VLIRLLLRFLGPYRRLVAAVVVALTRLRRGRTSFVIAHRLSTIRNADTIVVMDNGRIVEQGRHAELPERRGLYHTLYTSQYTQPEAQPV